MEELGDAALIMLWAIVFDNCWAGDWVCAILEATGEVLSDGLLYTVAACFF